jgi:hypothetical protein
MLPNLPNTFFYCVHKRDPKEVALKVIKSEVVPLGDKDHLVSVLFECPICKHQFVYKITASAMKLFNSPGSVRT